MPSSCLLSASASLNARTLHQLYLCALPISAFYYLDFSSFPLIGCILSSQGVPFQTCLAFQSSISQAYTYILLGSFLSFWRIQGCYRATPPPSLVHSSFRYSIYIDIGASLSSLSSYSSFDSRLRASSELESVHSSLCRPSGVTFTFNDLRLRSYHQPSLRHKLRSLHLSAPRGFPFLLHWVSPLVDLWGGAFLFSSTPKSHTSSQFLSLGLPKNTHLSSVILPGSHDSGHMYDSSSSYVHYLFY